MRVALSSRRSGWLGVFAAALAGLSVPASAAEPRSELRIEPASVALAGRSASRQLLATLKTPDGRLRDVTGSCVYEVEGTGVAAVSGGGFVTPLADGDATLRVRLGSLVATVPVHVGRSARARPTSFRRDVAPVLSRAGCNMGTCHGNLNGKGGFKLSLRGDDPAADFLAITHDAQGRRLDLVRPAASLILTKPTGRIAHEGGRRFGHGSIEARALLAWIEQGAPDDPPGAQAIIGLSVAPSERILAPGALEQQLVVTASFSDGETADVTRQATFDVNDPTKAAVAPEGVVRVSAPCETAVSVRYMDRRATSRLAFPADRPNYNWSGPPAEHPIDVLVFRKLKALGVNAAPVCGDSVFLRRVFLDVIGRLPDPAETQAFLADQSPGRRGRLIDGLLERPEFADFWALKWADLLRNEEKTMGEKGAWVMERWLRDSIARDAPLDELARRVVSGLGSTWKNPPASFHRTNRDPAAAAESTAQVFLGVRIQCARCHNHPYDVWKQDDYYGLAAYFANIYRKEINNARSDRLDSHEITGDEVVYLKGPARIYYPRLGDFAYPRPLGGARLDPGQGDVLPALARWLTHDNRQFTRNLANRVWFHLLGRGVVEPVDDFRESNPPANPPLLEALTDELAKNGMLLKPLVRFITSSRTYQLSAAPDPTNRADAANFSHALVKLAPAETLLDAVSQVLDAPELFKHAPKGIRAVQLPGVQGDSGFLKTFGKPDRLLSCECERSDSTTLAQAFQMIGGPAVRRKLEAADNRIGRLLARGATDRELLMEFYLACLCRPPTDREIQGATAYLAAHPDRRAAWEDLVWALLNSKEFLLRR